MEAVQQKSDLELKQELIELVRSKEAVLIVGAGSSKRLGYPDWTELIQKIEKLTGECNAAFKADADLRDYKPLDYVEKMKTQIFSHEEGEKKYYGLFDRSFEPKQYAPNGLHFHKTLVSLPFRGLLTTNYDVVLEDALQGIGNVSAHKDSFIIHKNTAGQVHRFLMAITNEETRGVAHLHGKYDDAEKVILSSKDYEKAYASPIIQETSNYNFFKRFCYRILRKEENQAMQSSSWTLHRKLLWAVLATRRVVFVGFSMKDPYFLKMLESVSNDLWRWDRPIHFAIMSISSNSSESLQARRKAARFKKDYGIETLFYTDIDGNHSGLADIVDEIAKELNITVPLDKIHPDSPNEVGYGLNKVKQMSQHMSEKISNGN
ncbi:MAG: SIR2 family protein [Candidatus Poribacteria bacterium]|nr:SIR2 family protein [Candidatus Poribacteria bacterium]